MIQYENDRKRIPTFDETASFHGHACPGLALGYRVAVAAMNRLDAWRSQDEGLLAIVENDACGVDAVQYVCGCTFGKGNLIFLDHGKHVYTFFNRAADKGIRIYAEPPESIESDTAMLARKSKRSADEQQTLDDGRKLRIDWLLSLPEDKLLRTTVVHESPPPKARIHESDRCSACGERMMKTRSRLAETVTLCISCAEGETDQTSD